MTIIAKPHGDFEPNTTAESAKVNDQINTLYTDHNGQLSDANIAPTANIQQSKIQDLPSRLVTINDAINGLDAGLNIALSTLVHDVNEPSASAVGESEVFAPISVPADTLGTTNYIFVSQDFLLNMVTGANCQLRYYYGGILFFAPTITNASGVTQSLATVHVDLTIKARNSVVSQFCIGRLFLQTTSDNFYAEQSSRGQSLNATAIAVDSSADETIQTNAVFDVTGNTITGVSCSSWLLK